MMHRFNKKVCYCLSRYKSELESSFLLLFQEMVFALKTDTAVLKQQHKNLWEKVSVYLARV